MAFELNRYGIKLRYSAVGLGIRLVAVGVAICYLWRVSR